MVLLLPEKEKKKSDSAPHTEKTIENMNCIFVEKNKSVDYFTTNASVLHSCGRE